MKRIGLTGGIAAGKSTVAHRWSREPGTAIIETDLLAHEAYRPGTPTYAAVRKAFGDGIVKPDQTLDRRKLGEMVFADEQKRMLLNQIVHPAVREMWSARLDDLDRAGRTEMAVVVIPLLFEVGAEEQFEAVVAVGCSEQTQFARLKAKGLTAEQARARIHAQLPMAVKLDRADYAIWNDGEQGVLEQQADIIWKKLKE